MKPYALFSIDTAELCCSVSVIPEKSRVSIRRKVNVDRYDDRDLVRTNLIDSYDRIMAFMQKHLPDPFYLEGIERRSLRDAIFREVASNILIHREYISGVPARVIIEYGQVTSYNANRPHGFGILDPETFSPYPKNPVLGAFFREIDRADELGSGMRNLMKYCRKYSGVAPKLIEGDVFQMIIGVPEFDAAGKRLEQTTQQVTHQATHQVTPQVKRLLAETKGTMSRAELMASLSLKDRVNFMRNYLEPALALELIEMTQPASPQSPTQKYRLTEKGLRSVKGD